MKSNVVKSESKRDKSIQIIRIFSMLLIIICHIASESNISIIHMSAQFFNVGVFIFLFISVFLYGKKDIDDIKKFYKGRIVKVLLPVYIFIVLLYIITFIINKQVDFKYLGIYFLNIQFLTGGMQGANHLWFITVIVICYIITPFLSKNKFNLLKYEKYILLGLLILSIIFAFINQIISKTILRFIVYLLGYIYVNKNYNINIIKSISIFVVAIIMRLIGRKLLDETIIYNIFISFFSQTLLTISIFNILKKILEKLLEKKIFKNEKVINYLDEYSFYIYITHYMFFEGPLRVMSITNFFIINIFIALILTYISAVILHSIYKFTCNITIKT